MSEAAPTASEVDRGTLPDVVVSARSTGCAAGRSRGVRRTGRRPRARYSGPCFRGSAYSRGFTVQYVPESAPTQAAPSQTGSSSVAPSYVVEPGCALGAALAPGCGRAVCGARRGAGAGRTEGTSRRDAPIRPAPMASASATSYASVIRANVEVAVPPPIASGCVDLAKRRKAALTSRADGCAGMPSTRHASSLRIFAAGTAYETLRDVSASPGRTVASGAPPRGSGRFTVRCASSDVVAATLAPMAESTATVATRPERAAASPSSVRTAMP